MRSTRGQIVEFSQGFIWQDMLEEIDIWIKQIGELLENSSMELSHRKLDQLGGSAKALRNMKDLCNVLINLAEDEEYENEFLKDLKDLRGGRND